MDKRRLQMSVVIRNASVLIVLLSMSVAHAGDLSEVMTDPGDRAVYQWLLKRAGKQAHIERNKNGDVQWIGYKGESKYTASLYLDEQGHVVRLMFNKPAFRNDELDELAKFRHVKKLKLWHNFDDKGPNGYRTGPDPMSGAGWSAFKDHGVTSFSIGGCNFDGDGLRATATFPKLDELGFSHTRVSDADLAALKGHPTLRSIRMSPMWSDHITNKALEHVATIPNLQQLRINETYLTYEHGLKHLEKLRGTLREVDLDNCVITPEDVARFKSAMPKVTVKQKPIEEVGRLIATNFKGAYRKLSKRAPKEVIEHFRKIGEKAAQDAKEE